jgi:NAD(P)-dependent dehydrogenase (short-subunit alcohol dehydrogenase family)
MLREGLPGYLTRRIVSLLLRDEMSRNKEADMNETHLNQERVIVFGGCSGIGEATARLAREEGSHVVVVGRNRDKLDAAVARIGRVQGVVADATDRAAVERAFSESGPVDHVVICVSGGKGAGLFTDVDLADVRQAFEAKTFAQLNVAQIAARRITRGGSITFVTAASARSVIRGTAGLAAVNGAIEAAVPVLALELAPTRVNAVSPGIVDTPWWEGMPASAKEAFFRTASATLPVGRVAKPEEIARALLFIMRSGFVTGSVYEIDGGGHLAMH